METDNVDVARGEESRRQTQSVHPFSLSRFDANYVSTLQRTSASEPLHARTSNECCANKVCRARTADGTLRISSRLCPLIECKLKFSRFAQRLFSLVFPLTNDPFFFFSLLRLISRKRMAPFSLFPNRVSTSSLRFSFMFRSRDNDLYYNVSLKTVLNSACY